MHVEFASDQDLWRGDQPWVSVVIGRNGIGKSRLLAGIVELFDELDTGRSRRGAFATRPTSLEYQIGGDRFSWHADDSRKTGSATINGNDGELADGRLPRRVIAVATTPFDKFKLTGPNASQANRVYRYLGLRDPRGRASAAGAVFRALDSLIEASGSTPDRRSRVADVFEFLGYLPRLEVRYRWSFRAMRQTHSLAELKASVDAREGLRPTALHRMVQDEPELLERVFKTAQETRARTGSNRDLSLVVDFREPGIANAEFFRDLQLLRRAEMVSIEHVELTQRSTGHRFDLQAASSGELALVTTFLGLASVMEDDSLVVIDEPEVSLHPEWQAQYIELLTKTFAKYRGCHFVIATHSPLILSDISPTRSNVVSLESQRRTAEDSEPYAGQSSDFLLLAAFKVPGKNNLYLKQQMVEALRLAADGDVTGERYQTIVSSLADVAPSLDEGSPVKELIENLVSAASEITLTND